MHDIKPQMDELAHRVATIFALSDNRGGLRALELIGFLPAQGARTAVANGLRRALVGDHSGTQELARLVNAIIDHGNYGS